MEHIEGPRTKQQWKQTTNRDPPVRPQQGKSKQAGEKPKTLPKGAHCATFVYYQFIISIITQLNKL